MIKLIAIDLDGTLLREDKTLSKGNIEALHQAHEAGYDIVICTGRPLSGVRPIFEAIDLPEGDYYMIINNGCTTLSTKKWEILGKEELTLNDMHRLYQLTEDHKVQLTLFDLDHYLVVEEEASQLVAKDADMVHNQPKTVHEEDLSRYVPIFQAMYVGEPTAVDAFQTQHEAGLETDFNTVRSQDILFEVLPKGASKASALQALSQKLGYRREQVMALGDANNDLEMLRFAGYSVAMGNGNAAVKEIADFITLTNDDDGVAYAIHKLIETEKGE